MQRYEGENLSLHLVQGSGEAAVAKAVPAFVGVQLCLGGLPARIPDACAVFDIKILSVIVIGYIVVTITGQAEKLGVLIEGITSAGIGIRVKKSLQPR